MKNILNLLDKYENRHDGNLHKIISFSDGSGTIINCEAESEIFQFETQEELENFLKN
ncbi:MAG: hypothetical protein WC389_00070 [Lutibacter sp.]|jgi:hypothetical protein